ncbi:hypothetical protein NPIL_566941, partial [Nephila pilipes]
MSDHLTYNGHSSLRIFPYSLRLYGARKSDENMHSKASHRLSVGLRHNIKIKLDPPEEVTSIQDLVTKDDNEILEEIFIEAVDFVAHRY